MTGGGKRQNPPSGTGCSESTAAGGPSGPEYRQAASAAAHREQQPPPGEGEAAGGAGATSGRVATHQLALTVEKAPLDARIRSEEASEQDSGPCGTQGEKSEAAKDLEEDP